MPAKHTLESIRGRITNVAADADAFATSGPRWADVARLDGIVKAKRTKREAIEARISIIEKRLAVHAERTEAAVSAEASSVVESTLGPEASAEDERWYSGFTKRARELFGGGHVQPIVLEKARDWLRAERLSAIQEETDAIAAASEGRRLASEEARFRYSGVNAALVSGGLSAVLASQKALGPIHAILPAEAGSLLIELGNAVRDMPWDVRGAHEAMVREACGEPIEVRA